jgi:hypothetical protein
MKMRTPLLILSILALLALPSITSAQTDPPPTGGPSLGWNGWGIRAGVSSDPDQVYGGVHFNLGEFATNVRFRPSLEVGFGDDVTLVQVNAEVHYVFNKVQVWKPYVGGLVDFSWYDLDDAPPQADDSDTNVGLMGVGGVETRLKSGVGMFFEGKIGLTDDDPDFKVGIGWSWK